MRRAVALPALLLVLLAVGCAGQAEGGATADDSAPGLVDGTTAAGIDFTHGAFRWAVSADPVAMMGGGACWLDADDDGWLDLYLVNTWAESEHASWIAEGGLPQSTLLRNDRGTFTDVGEATGSALGVRGMGCLAADLNADGATDLFITTARTSVLLWNDGDGTFTPDGGQAGLGVYGWHSVATAGDVDGDGLVDVFIGGYVDLNSRLDGAVAGFPRTHRPIRDLLFRNLGPTDDGGATFEEVGAAAGLDPDGHRYTLGAAFTDLDGDHDLDLVVANDTDPNRLYENRSSAGQIHLVDIAADAGADDAHSGMGVATGDLTGDGGVDLIVTNLGEQGHTLLVGGPDAPEDAVRFEDGGEALGAADLGAGLTGWGTSLTDLDGDGHLDVLVGSGAIPISDLASDAQPMLAYQQDPQTGALVDRSGAWGVGGAGEEGLTLNARGVSVADHDNDGDPDVAVVDVGGRARLLVNHAPAGRWLVVDPEDRVPGTVVTVRLASGTTLVRELRAGSSYLSTEDPRALFGIGEGDPVAQVEVRWPDGATAAVTDPPAGELLRISR